MTSWNTVLQDVSQGKQLSRETTRETFNSIMKGEATPAQIGALLMGMAQRGETPQELAGAAESLRSHAVRVPTERRPLLDTCGTGGDGSGTFNISTASAFVVAGAGVGVAKHGNRSISSACGSADVLEALGANIDLPPQTAAACLENTNIMFLFAPRYHPATGHAAPIRKELGIRTLFNLLGPLCNPAPVTHQVMGIFAPHLRETAAKVLGLLGLEHAMVVHGHGGLDEIALSGPTEATEVRGNALHELTIRPGELGLKEAPVSALKGGDAETNAGIIRAIMAGGQGPHTDVVVLNAGAALYVAGEAESIKDGVALAADTIGQGNAQRTLDAFVEFTRNHGG